MTSSDLTLMTLQTRGSLIEDLRQLGVSDGDILLTHSSLRNVGYVIGGAVTVVQALLDAVGPDGTVVVPSFTSGNCDPSRWALTRKAPVPPEWWPAIREHLPAFDPALSPSEGVGAVSEAVRKWPGAKRSSHPQTSFAAVGAQAAALMAEHERSCLLGPKSPLGHLAARGAKILLLGVPYSVCTTFHLAEYQQPDPPTRDYECVTTLDGRRTWYRYRDVVLNAGDFEQLGTALETSPTGPTVRRGEIGNAVARLIPMAEAVAFARTWLAAKRDQNQDQPARS
jgi:aminoglycoside 3-N-acetyltransferase